MKYLWKGEIGTETTRGQGSGVAGLRKDLVGRRAVLLAVGGAVLTIISPALAEDVSDDLLYDRVRRQLVNDRDLKILELEVTVEDGVVTVSGYVRTEKIRGRVDKVAKRVKGVKEVVNKVEVRP